jgi:hypothetical protein
MTQGHLATQFRIPSVFTNTPTQPFDQRLGPRFVAWPFINSHNYLLPPLLSASSSFLSHFVFISSVRRLLVKADVSSSLILVTLMMVELSSSETSILTRATYRNISGDAILHSHSCENLKSYKFFLCLSNKEITSNMFRWYK